ncbi:nuclear factor 7, brain-like [Cyprinus carpio]|uniref:Nuclear factor 7, brain-like n=1 Tax=Cyprinus carpio TaxID=7962 RepID=A0A9R0AQB2_CYPCA|nr:nuclear factor 7, brain-like [Cyprinus carpio]
MDSFSVKEISCPICCEIFKAPVLLSCSHSFCEECLQQFWRTKNTRECPVCRRRSSRDDPPCNLVLKNLCESYLKERRNKKRLSGSEEACGLHSEKLKLFCLEDKQPVCLVCRDSQKHVHHRFRPISEVVSSHKEELKSLQEKLKHREEFKEECVKTLQHIRSQAEHTECQIKLAFEKPHKFLRDEEEIAITALREEKEQKNQMMQEKFEEINRHISALSHTIRDLEKMMNASEVLFLKKFPDVMERVKSLRSDPQLSKVWECSSSGLLSAVGRGRPPSEFRHLCGVDSAIPDPVPSPPSPHCTEHMLSPPLTESQDRHDRQAINKPSARAGNHTRKEGESRRHPEKVPVPMSNPEKIPVPTSSPERAPGHKLSPEAHKCPTTHPLLLPPPLSSGSPSGRPQPTISMVQALRDCHPPASPGLEHSLTPPPASKPRTLPRPFDPAAPPWQVFEPKSSESVSSVERVFIIVHYMSIRIAAAVDCVSSAPVILDPNTAHPDLLLSDDLTSLTCSTTSQALPDNPERFKQHSCVLGSEGFNSGTHCWDVDVKESLSWSLGVTTASNQRKGYDFFDSGVWSVQHRLFEESGFPVVQKLERVRVQLDYDGGTVSFSDPVKNTPLYTFTATFTETVFPFFYSFSHLRIL